MYVNINIHVVLIKGIFLLKSLNKLGQLCVFTSSGPAIDARVRDILSWKNNFPLLLIQEELVVSYCKRIDT